MSYSVRSRNRSSGTRTCATCAHDGQCDGLPNCGGSCWEDAYTDCAQCGERVRYEDSDWENEAGQLFCSEECLDAWERDHKDEKEDEEDGE